MLMNVQGNVSFKKTKSVRFSMEDKIIQSKFMKDYKAIFRDSDGSGKQGKWLKNHIWKSHGLFKCFWKQDFFFGGGGGGGGEGGGLSRVKLGLCVHPHFQSCF